jgi:peptidoglycan/xylan/chitin deacetylase (PgdA/CDA1 family)
LSRTTPRGRRSAPAWLPAVLAILLAGCGGAAAPTAAPTPSTVAPAPTEDEGPDTSTPTSMPDGELNLVAGKAIAMQKGTGAYGALVRTGSDGVGLTFDDGPDPTYTPQMLDLLKETGVKATFCVVGKRAILQPDLLRRIVAEGHTLCNHSYYHDLALGKMSVAAMTKDLQDTLDAIHKAVPDYQVRYFRAPGGNFTQTLVTVATSLGMRSLSWAIDPRDWDFPTYGHGQGMVNHILSVVQSQARPGVVILSHDLGKPDTIAAYRILIPWLKARYTLVPMPEF